MRISPRRMLFSAVMASALVAGNPLSAFAGTGGAQWAQQANTVEGIVTDANGEPIIGASIVIKGTTNGTITDLDGKFSLPNATGTLVVSYIGYKTQEIVLNGQKQLKIVMQEDSEILEEVVVVGYGTVKKESLTGSVTVVDDKAFAENNPDAVYGEMIRRGATIIQTDRPQLLLEYLRSKGLHD